MNWTRARDAWIAREIEGIQVWVMARDGLISDTQGASIPHYNTDLTACIRAAEAWAAKDSEYWSWTLARAATLLAHCMHDQWHYIHEGEDGLAWALYDATGGPT
jgi:hypothetical protein